MDEAESSTRPGGTRMRQRTEPEPVVVEGVVMPSLSALPSFNASLHHCAADYFRNLDKDVLEPMREKQRQRVKEANKKGSAPPITVADSFNWTTELEERAKRELETTKEHWTLPKALKSEYLGLCKTALLYTARTPRDIVGVETQLCFALDSKSVFEGHTPHPLRSWSRLFCDKLCQLITHQAWATSQPGGRAACLATALQYAVILRTKDKREWWMRGTDSFLDGIQRATQRGTSPREAHAQRRDALFSSGDFIPTYHISNVFKALEEVVKERPGQIAAHSPYYVTTEDLINLTQALDGMTDPETGCANLSTAMFYKMAMAVRPNRGLKPTGDELDAVHKNMMLEECRRMLHYERF